LAVGQFIRECGGGGHCLFFSASAHIFGSADNYHVLRHIASIALDDPVFFERYILPVLGAPGQTPDDVRGDLVADSPCATWAEYINAIATSNMYATQDQAIAIAHVSGIAVDVQTVANGFGMRVLPGHAPLWDQYLSRLPLDVPPVLTAPGAPMEMMRYHTQRFHRCVHTDTRSIHGI
jgi:hypothetical protein